MDAEPPIAEYGQELANSNSPLSDDRPPFLIRAWHPGPQRELRHIHIGSDSVDIDGGHPDAYTLLTMRTSDAEPAAADNVIEPATNAPADVEARVTRVVHYSHAAVALSLLTGVSGVLAVAGVLSEGIQWWWPMLVATVGMAAMARAALHLVSEHSRGE